MLARIVGVAIVACAAIAIPSIELALAARPAAVHTDGQAPDRADPRQRLEAEQQYLGIPTARAAQDILRVGATEHAKSSRAPLVSTPAWMNLGPSNARFEYNGTVYPAIDSGRVNEVRILPGSADTVFIGTAGGGIWKTTNFSAANQTWTAIGDNLAALAVGSFDISPSDANTIVTGIGDPFDSVAVGGGVTRTVNGGANWSAPILLTNARNIRDVRFDPSNANIVLVAADSGLFRSIDGGANFSSVPLPNLSPTPGAWSIGFVGTAAGQSRWVVSGQAGNGTSGLGDLYLSTDSGASFGSLRFTGGLPSTVTPGRMEVGAGTASDPTTNTVYVAAANVNGSAFAAMLKSTNGGTSFASIATASTVPTNPTLSTDCQDFNVGQAQAWYDLTIAVDPTSANNVITGGNLCGYRSTDGGTTWSVISSWLPPLLGQTAAGTLGYAHADWHAAAIAPINGGVRTIVGDDGGVGSADDVFSNAVPENIGWRSPNQGLRTFQFYGVASGDPAHSDADFVQAGAQDNGTRFRDLTYGQPVGTFNQVIGGDGIETTVGRTSGGGAVYWASVEFARAYCVPAKTNCDSPASYTRLAALPNEPFNVRYSAVQGDSHGAVLTANLFDVYRLLSSSPGAAPVKVSSGFNNGGARQVRDLDASPFVYSTPFAGTRLYGVALSGGFAAIGTDSGGVVTWAVSPQEVGTGSTSNLLEQFTTGVAIPRSASHLGGTTDGQTYILSTAAPYMLDGSQVPASIGRLFLTTDGGNTWHPLHGNGTSDLPNVPIYSVRFDRSDTTDQTIFVGTELGVYETADGGQTWARVGSGLPNVAVRDIYLSPDGNFMRIATYGRGVWEIALHAPATSTLLVPSSNPSGQSVTLVATVSPVMPTGSVTFFDGTTSLGTVALSGYPAQASITTGPLTLGVHNLTASYAGDGFYAASTSPALAQSVRRSTSTGASCGSASDPVGAPVKCTATVTDTGGGTPTSPTGKVFWSVGAGLGAFSAASCKLAAGKCSVTYTPAGGSESVQTITASYTGGTTDTLHADSKGVTNLTVVKPTAILVGDAGKVLVSVDGGATWKIKTSGTNNNLHAISQPSNTIAFAVGDAGTILVTKKNGSTWAAQTSGTSHALLGVSFFSTSAGIAVGAGGTVLVTANGGTSWTTATSPTSADLTSVSFVTATTAYAVGKGGVIMKTVNGGTTWTLLTSGTTQDLTSVRFVSASIGFAVGKAGTIITTVNGSAWSAQTSGTAQDLSSVAMLSSTTGIVVGAGGTLLTTSNGGSAWTAVASGTAQNLNGIIEIDNLDAMAAGDAGAVLVSINGGTSWSAAVSGTASSLRGAAGR